MHVEFTSPWTRAVYRADHLSPPVDLVRRFKMCYVDIELERLMRREEVLHVCGISKTTLDEMIKAGTFPKPVRINERAAGWRVKDILGWLASRPVATGTNWR